jgi:hypothetical protein
MECISYDDFLAGEIMAALPAGRLAAAGGRRSHCRHIFKA